MSLEDKEQLGFYLQWKKARRYPKSLFFGILAGELPNSYYWNDYYTEGRDAYYRMLANVFTSDVINLDRDFETPLSAAESVGSFINAD